MEIHLKFRPGEQKRFIEKVKISSSWSINQLSALVQISPRNFRDWKNEKLTISISAALKLSSEFNVELPEKIDILESRWRESIVERGKKGGITYKTRYGNPGTTEGRKKAGIKTLSILRREHRIPEINNFETPEHSEKLAEFIGIMLGDGNVGKLQISITLNSVKDFEYSKYVVNLCKSLFGKGPKVRKRKNANALEIYFNGINLIDILIKEGLVRGNKVKNQVDVPSWVKKNKKYSIQCLRGLMDTDGGIFIHKYKVNGKTYFYQKVNFTNQSIPLLRFVYETLVKLNFHPKILDRIENKKVWLYNSHEVQRYLSVVGSSNLRLNRFKIGGVA